jgi:putative flippase GtrA
MAGRTRAAGDHDGDTTATHRLMREPIGQVAHDYVRYGVVGAVSTGFHWGLLALLVEGARLEATLSTTIGYALSSVLSYLLNYFWTFSSTERHVDAAGRFMLVMVSGLALNAGIFALLLYVGGLHYLYAQVLATLLVSFWNFGLNRWWSFRAARPC